MPKPLFQSVTPLLPAWPDLASDIHFFTAELGFAIVWQGDGAAGIRRGNVQLLLVQSDNRTWAENVSVGISVDDLDALYEEYHATSARLGPVEVKPWGRREFHMILPSGVCLQFFQG